MNPPVGLSGIYSITCANGNRYIGSAVKLSHRWDQHRHELRKGSHHSHHMQNAWKKYGEAAFAFEVLEECEPEFLVSSEQWWINMLRPEYNLSPTAGSSLGCRRTPETRAKIAAAGTGRPCSDETRAKRSVAMTGRTVSVEHRAKLSVALTGNKNGLGSKRTPESKAKMSEAQMGNTKTKGSKRTPETNAKQSASMKIVWAKRRAK